MGLPFNGDLVPTESGRANLGVEVGPNAINAFDLDELRPFGHIHLNSGVFHHPTSTGWESGVIRYNSAASCFELSVNGGISFGCIATTDNAVTSVGVIGDADLTGDIDLAVPSSGFLTIFDTSNASPINFAVDQLGLSGLWDFPTQGFNGRVVNALTDFHGTEAQGVVNVVGASGIVVDIVGQTMTVSTSFDNGIATCYAETFTAATQWVVNHNLGTEDVQVMIYNNTSPRRAILPDGMQLTSANTVTINFNTAQAGRAVVIGCKS